MSASELQEFPYNTIFNALSRIFLEIGDQPDILIALSERKEIPAEQRKEAISLVNEIRKCTSGVCWAVDDLMRDIDDLTALGQFSHHGNTLEGLAERAMVLIEVLDPEQPASPEWEAYLDTWVKSREGKGE